MELLVQIAIAIFWICAIIVGVGIVQLISSKGKSKIALRMVIIPIIIVVAMLLIGLGSCILIVMNN